MKSFINHSKTKAPNLSYEDALKHIYSVYGDQVKMEFDDSCVSSVTYKIEKKEISGAIIAFDRIKIISGDHVLYWPILPKHQEIERENAQQMDFYTKFRVKNDT